MRKKIIILAVIVLLAAVFFVLGLQDYFSLDFLQRSRAGFAALCDDHPVLVVGAYGLIYILVTGLSLPGATIMTLAGGALFGLTVGVVVVSFASAIGATLACWLARFFLRSWVQRKFGRRLEKINDGMAREGAFYLFALRLVPVFPFWLVNLAMSLTALPLRTFYWVSQIGMLPATVVYINAGREIGRIQSLSDILSPGLIVSFVILGLFPIAAKKALSFFGRRRNYSRDQLTGRDAPSAAIPESRVKWNSPCLLQSHHVIYRSHIDRGQNHGDSAVDSAIQE